jgi:pyrroline-5-carboxylate reductase
MQPPARSVVFIGLGSMGGAIARAGVHAGVLVPTHLTLIDHEPSRCADLGARGARVFTEVGAWLGAGSVAPGTRVVLAVKPQGFAPVASALQGRLAPDTLLLSIMAGVRIERLARDTGAQCVVRAMPNLPASVGQGVTAVCAGERVSPHDAQWVDALFFACGPAVVACPEPMLDAFTALAGSGPAYVYLLAECLAHAARQQGFEPDAAEALARQTIIGAARLLEADERTPRALREAVTSKGGTTAAACAVLEGAGLARLVHDAVQAGTQRSRELAG